ncbi:hypothetical protein C9374_000833 [Naegleria lovaniensis]|uniref:non-specific serine/threonine protein kinase n=1 Tax=Naegleria lovaniensis TaxID=51637 RepID=A0AA88KMW0_NAELO|nr:uncharacterized protein C9374_000833 [Naegleria lovaniensis]KAG2387983.1 hypothetical protein C9374_000833 [Naegleria lovaniensis]
MENHEILQKKQQSRHGRRLSDHLMEICEKKYSTNTTTTTTTSNSASSESLPDIIDDDLIGGSGIVAAMRHGLLLNLNVKENNELERKGSLQRRRNSDASLTLDSVMPVIQAQPRKRASIANLFFTEWSKTEEKIVNKINDISTKTMNERSWETDYEGGLKVLKEDIKVLWKNQSLRNLFYNANDFGFHVHENIIYFMKNINRIFREDYKPTEDDYLKMRCVTTGITSVDIKINKSSVIKLYDTGGERCERRKWNALLDANPNAIIYVVSLSDFDMYSTDQKDKNKMQDSIDELKNLCQEMNMRSLKNTEFLIVLNKSDAFKEKIEEKGKCISSLFPEFKTNQGMTISAFTALSTVNYSSSTNDNNSDTKQYEKSLKFIGRLLHNIVKSELPSQKAIHMYETCALDKEDIKYIFEDGLEPLLRPANDMNRPSAKNDNIRILVDEKRTINIGEFASNASLSKHAGNRANTMPAKKQPKRRPLNSFFSILKQLVPPPPPPSPFLNSVSEAYDIGPPKPYHKNISNPKLTPEEEERVNSALQDNIEEGKGNDYSEKYSIKKQIGKGGQAFTYIVAEKDAVSDKKFYVMKRIKMKTIQELNQNFNEIKSLYSLRHEYINSIHDFFVEQKESTIVADNIEGDDKQNLSGKQEYVLCIILEFCKGGDMRMYLDRFKKKGITTYVSQTQIVKWLKKLTIALVFIHSKGYLHRDLKPENIFFNDLEREELRLGDFGLSCLVKSTKDASVGTINYMSPEQCKGEGYSASSDIWSLGAIVLEILTQRTVNVREELEKDPNYVNHVCNELKDIYSEELLDFVCMTLQLDPQARPSTPEQLLALVENIE